PSHRARHSFPTRRSSDLQDPNADLAATARVIALDPALSARMLRVANSPLYAGRRKVENLPQALTLLGLNATLSLALGFSLMQGRSEEHTSELQSRENLVC